MALVSNTLDNLLKKAESLSNETQQFLDTITQYNNVIELALADLHGSSAEKEFEQLKGKREELVKKVFGPKSVDEEYTPNLLFLGRYAKKMKKIMPQYINEYRVFAEKYDIDLD